MNLKEKQSLRKKKSILYLVEKGEYSVGYALFKTEELHDNSKLIESDYEELAEYLEDLLNKVEEVVEPVETIEEPIEDLTEVTEEQPVEQEEIIEETPSEEPLFENTQEE